jgi:hypothetical protein
MESIGNSLLQSSIQRWDETSPTCQIEKTTEELQKIMDGLSAEVENGLLATPQLWEFIFIQS